MSMATVAVSPPARVRLLSSDVLIRIGGGIALLGLWEISVRLFAAPFVARPTRRPIRVPATNAMASPVSTA
jgi:hypothetical protein